MRPLKKADLPYKGYEVKITLEEKYSNQVFLLNTVYEGATYSYAAQKVGEIIKSFNDNDMLIVTNGEIRGYPYIGDNRHEIK